MGLEGQGIETFHLRDLAITRQKLEAALLADIVALEAMTAGTTGDFLFRVNVTTALVNAGATAIVPALTGKRFHVRDILMKSNGVAAGATTVGIKEDGGAVFLSHVVADLTDGVWHDLVTGTPVITGITAGGTTAVANKGLVAYCAGGTLTGTTSVDYIVHGFYTT